MAITTRGKNTLNSAGWTGFTINKPTGTVDNDVMFTFISFNAIWTAPNVPSGWTQVFLDTANGTVGLWRRVASGEGASYSWSWTTQTDGAVGIISFTGVDTGTPVLGFSQTLGVTTNPVVWPAISSWGTPADAVSALLWGGQAANPTTPPLPSGWNDSTDGFTDTDGFQPAQFATNLTTQSGVTTLPLQTSGSMTSAGFYDCFQVAIKVAAGAPAGGGASIVNVMVF